MSNSSFNGLLETLVASNASTVFTITLIVFCNLSDNFSISFASTSLLNSFVPNAPSYLGVCSDNFAFWSSIIFCMISILLRPERLASNLHVGKDSTASCNLASTVVLLGTLDSINLITAFSILSELKALSRTESENDSTTSEFNLFALFTTSETDLDLAYFLNFISGSFE